jgi:hypothetical protein
MKTPKDTYTQDTYTQDTYKRYLQVSLLILLAALCSACGAKQVRGEPPIVSMNDLSHRDGSINLQLSMRNVNDLTLNVLDIDFSLTANDDELVGYKGPVNTDIAANGTEIWSVDVEESGAARELLDSLENGDINSLPYLLKGSVTSQDAGDLSFEYEGHIYPRPGRPGHFR